MKNITYRNIIKIFLLFIVFIILNTGNSKAVLQANGNEGATYNLSDWMMNVRKMEELGGSMGLSESIESNLTNSNNSNNIDVHMQKNTEYGALVILSASSYGKPDKVNDGETTTGNVTGAVMRLNAEWVAASLPEVNSVNLRASSNRYKNVYSKSYVAKSGDAITETEGWYGSDSKITSNWITNTYGGLMRSYIKGNSIFSYNGAIGSNVATSLANVNHAYHGCAVIVSGEGF